MAAISLIIHYFAMAAISHIIHYFAMAVALFSRITVTLT